MKRFIIFFVALVTLGSCMKEVSYKTTFILNPYEQVTSDSESVALEGVLLYAFSADTTSWKVASYEDAAFGIITNKESGEQKGASVVGTTSASSTAEKVAIEMYIDFEQAMIVAVDTKNRCYAYTNYKIGVNLPTTYMSVLFRSWKYTAEYSDGKWRVIPTIYDVNYKLNTYVEMNEGGTAEPLSGAVGYLFDADTTSWGIASYEDALAGVITNKSTGEQLSSSTKLSAAEDNDSQIGVETSLKDAMVVVVDPINEWYAYTDQVFDYSTNELSRDVVFSPWNYPNGYESDGWWIQPAIYNIQYLVTTYIQEEQSGESLPFREAKAYAFEADTTAWRVMSYEDATLGIITHKQSGEQIQATTTSTMIDADSLVQLQLNIDFSQAMVVVVDEQNSCYAYTNYTFDSSITEYLTLLTFRPWDNAQTYDEDEWMVIPTIVEEPEVDEQVEE